MSETAHPDLDFTQKTFKSLVWDNALTLGLELLFANAPYLNIWLVRSIITSIAQMSANWLYASLKLVADMSAIPLINAQLKTRFDNDSAALRIVAMKHGIDSKEFNEAREEAADAFAEFFRFNASRPRK